MRKSLTRVGAVAAAVLVVSGGVALANGIVGPDGVIHGCYATETGMLRVVAEGEACRANEQAISWNQIGPEGPQGPVGPQGPQGEKGDTGDTGPQGPPGEDGKTLLNGTAPPESTIGVLGDFYLDMATSTLYGPKTADGWGTGVSLVGPQGPQGIQGPKGDTGSTGATGPQGPQGPKGDKGDTGAIGPQGPQGPAGVSGWVRVESDPFGVDGLSARTESVSCPFPKRVMGGGFFAQLGGLADGYGVNSMPSSDGRGWTATVRYPTLQGGSFRVYAICATVS